MNAPVRPNLILTDAQCENMARCGAFAKVGRVELRGEMLTPRRPASALTVPLTLATDGL